jgi:hypothetical protein
MGQYHVLYNTDKKEYVHGHRIDNGLKLIEQVGFEKSTATALFLLVANSNGRGGGDVNEHELIGRWAGDRIVVQGDYAEEGDQAYINDAERKTYTDISAEVLDLLNKYNE